MSTWREIADLLGTRLEHHDYCLEGHETPEENPACPFCMDRIAIAEWRKKKNRTVREITREANAAAIEKQKAILKEFNKCAHEWEMHTRGDTRYLECRLCQMSMHHG